MVGALGVNQAMLFTAVFALGAGLAGFGGALQVAREPANLATDLTAISDAFVVVVVGGMGSISGAYLAAVIIAEVKAICIGIGVVDFGFVSVNFSKFTLVAEFLVMAVVLIARPYGLLGRAQAAVRSIAQPEEPIRPATPALKALGLVVLALLLCLPLLAQSSPYLLILGIDVLIAVIFATSLHFIMGPGGMHSFGHAAYFGLGAYGAALLVKGLAVPMGLALVAAPLVALAGALLFGWFAVRLSGVYLAMLTLAFAQIVWATVFQWEDLTGGSNGVIGVWPPPPFDRTSVYFLLTLALAVIAVLLLRRLLFAPFGYAMRAGRDSALRAEAIGIDVKRVHWLGFAVAGAVCGVAGGLFAFAKGSISPETIHINRSIDGLVMVLLGGIQTLTGPIVGASVFATLAGHGDAADRILARAAGRHHPAAGAGVPARHRRRLRGAVAQGASHERARGPLVVQGLRRRARGQRGQLRGWAGRIPRHDRAERRRQDHLLQYHQRPARAGFRRDTAGGQEHRGLAAARDLAARRRPHLSGRRHLRLDDGRRERADGADLARGRKLPAVAPGGIDAPRALRWRCSSRSACAKPPTGRAASSPMATSSASSSPSRSPTSRGCC